MDQQRKIITLTGQARLRAGAWHHIVAVFTGNSMRLHEDGTQDGAEIPLHGLRSDNESGSSDIEQKRPAGK